MSSKRKRKLQKSGLHRAHQWQPSETQTQDAAHSALRAPASRGPTPGGQGQGGRWGECEGGPGACFSISECRQEVGRRERKGRGGRGQPQQLLLSGFQCPQLRPISPTSQLTSHRKGWELAPPGWPACWPRGKARQLCATGRGFKGNPRPERRPSSPIGTSLDPGMRPAPGRLPLGFGGQGDM